MMGVVFSAFSWTYAAVQLPAAFFDRLRRELRSSSLLTLWSDCSSSCKPTATGLGAAVYRRPRRRRSRRASDATAGSSWAWFRRGTRNGEGIYIVGEMSPPFSRSVHADGGLWLAGAVHRRRRRGTSPRRRLRLAYRCSLRSPERNNSRTHYIAAGGGFVTNRAREVAFSWADVKGFVVSAGLVRALVSSLGNSNAGDSLDLVLTYPATVRDMPGQGRLRRAAVYRGPRSGCSRRVGSEKLSKSTVRRTSPASRRSSPASCRRR